MSLGDAVDNPAILNKTLNHPVIIAGTRNALIHATLAQIVVAIVTDIAVVVHIRDGDIAAIAVHRVVVHVCLQRCTRAVTVRTKGSTALLSEIGKLGVPSVTGSSSFGDGNALAIWAGSNWD